MRILVTGGAGFIGSNFINYILNNTNHEVHSLDWYTYAADFSRLDGWTGDQELTQSFVDIRDKDTTLREMSAIEPDCVVHFAACSHVDRSILDPRDFFEVNVMGTFNLLEAFKKVSYRGKKKGGRFLLVSTDEVFGSIAEGKFTELSNYDPRSPYAASKAAADHMVRSYFHTYGMDIVVTNCTNNYGPNQDEEKFIPKAICSFLRGQILPVYGQGLNVRNWLHVQDHCRGVLDALFLGRKGETYCFGSEMELSNNNVVARIISGIEFLREADKLPFDVGPKDLFPLIAYVKDRPGHDFRYALDCNKAMRMFSWRPNVSFENGLRETILHYSEKLSGG
jgi:dTDP-glucose 4,6-dehydratase